jgi:hypothetical protein
VRAEDALGSDQPAILEKTHDFLEETFQNWLLVLDNADSLDNFVKASDNETSISKHMPRRGRILITTRDPRVLGNFVWRSQVC